MQSAMSPSSLSSAAAAVSTSRRDVALQPPPIIPFVEFVLRALEHPHYMFVSKLAACCAMLYLARSDQELQLSLSHKWAVRFAMDRGRLLEVIRRRTRQHRSRLFGSEAMTGVTATATTASSSSSAAAAAADMSPTTSSSSPPAHDTATESKTAAVDALHTCDPSVVVEHLMRILDSLIPMYFSWNWHRIDYVIQLNKEYEAFVRENILPLCIASTAEDGVDDAAHTSWLVPSNIDSANHALLRFSQQQQQQQLASSSSSSSSSTPVITSTFVRSNGAATASRQASPLTSDDNDNNNNNSSSSNNNNNSSSNNNSSDDNSKSKSSAVTTTRHADTLAPLPLSSAMGVLSPTTTPSTSTTVNKADADDNGAAAVGGGGGATSASNVSALPTFPVLDTTMSNNNNNKTDVVATGAATPAVRTHNNNSSMTLPATTTMVPSMVYSPTLGTPATEVPEAGLAFLTISNYAAALRDNHSGLVTIFHAKYSSKSVHVVRLFQRLVEQQLVSPMPVVAVVFAVAEPELSSLYNISWFPTIIYTPPSALLAVDTATTATAAGTAGSSVSPRESEHEAAAHRPTTSTVTRPAASSSPLHSPTRRTGEVATLSPSEMLFGFAVGGSSGGGNNNKNNNSRAVANMTSSAATATTAAAALSSVPVALASTMTDGDGGGGGGSNNNSRSSASAAAVSAATAHALSELSASDVLLLSDDGGGELTARVASDGHVVYPMHAPTTLDAFVAWLRSHGRDVPPAAAATAAAPLSGLTAAATTTASSLSSNGGGSTAAGGGVAAAAAAAAASHLTARVNTMHAADKLKETGELRSAIVMLRRLQDSEAHRRLQSGGSSGNNTGNSGSARDRATAPLFIFLGGGMAAGKSTAAMALAQSAWWREHKDHSVLVNADEFKVAEPLYERAPADMHERSTRAAESLLVQAINQGRSTVLDGTMMWAPFVQQVIDMLRNAHTTLYTRGPGYRPGAEERYFVAVGRRPVPLPLPYVIRFIGITVDPEIAVPRGFVRKYATGRGVPISMQLRSFRLFAENFEKYAALVDATTLLNNNVFVDLKKGELPPVLAVCDESTGGKLRINDEAAYALFRKQRSLNEHAGNILELYV